MINDIIEANEKLKCNSKPMEILHRDFPQCFNAEGAFDIAVFQKLISGEVNVVHEGYNLDFLGKSYAKLLASVDTTTVVKPDLEHNRQLENAQSENIYISGDNLDALKHLLKSYAGKVKCIYIDPPYNTGSDGFVYNDKFSFTAEELEDRLSIDGDQASKILDMTSRGSASHSAWLTFMAPRLQLARDLLMDDGVIFISIDDNEQANLKVLCDSTFGEENLIACFCKKGSGGKQDSTHFARVHEYLLCYANEKFEAGEIQKEKDSYPNTDDDGKKYKTMLLRKWGDAALRIDRPNMYYPLYYDEKNNSISLKINSQSDVEVFPMIDKDTEGRWRWGIDTMRDALEKDLVEIRKVDGQYVAYEKIYEPSDDDIPTKLYNTWLDDINNKTGKALLKELFGDFSPFEYPKPLDLIKRVVKMGNAMDGIVLDFFSGSATTAHAIMEMNAEDNDHRRFIMVQWQEPCSPNSIAYKKGYKTIDDVGQSRIKLAAKRIKEKFPDTKADLGFKHYILEEQPENTLDKLESFDKNVTLTDDSILSLFGKETVLETWLVRDGYGFGAKVQPVRLDKYIAYLMDKHLYLIDVDFDVDDMVALMDKYNGEPGFNPENIVVFGYSFTFVQLELLQKNLITLSDGVKNKKVNIDVRY